MNEIDQQNNINSKFSFSDSINPGQILRIILMQSKLIFLLIFLGMSLGFGYYFFSEKEYKVSSLVQVYSKNTRNLSNDFSLDLFLGSSNTSDNTSFEDLYKSRTNLLKIIKDQKLNLDFKAGDYEVKKLISYFNVLEPKRSKIDFFISLEEETYSLFTKDQNLIEKINYGEKFESPELEVSVIKPNFKRDGLVEFSYRNPPSVYKRTKANFIFESSLPQRTIFNASNNGLIQISYVSAEPEEAINVLNFSNNLFLKNNIQIESEQARKAIVFIDERISGVERQLEIDKQNFKNFKESNKTIDVELEIQAIIDSLTRVETDINKLEIEISRASNNYTLTNPIYLDLLNQRDTLYSQRIEIESKIKDLPVAQQGYIDLLRDLEVTQQLYNELLNKKLEFSITEASTLGNIRIVDFGYVDSMVSPKFTYVIAIGMLSIFLSLIFAVIRGFFFLPISNPAELADNGINNPVLGVIGLITDEDEDSERNVQAFESLLVNIEAKIESAVIPEKKAKTILITSATASNGKSFISRTIAKNISLLGNKVLLIDNDLKRGDQHKSFSNTRISKEEFLKLDKENIEKVKINENLYFIPKISKLSSSFQFLYSPEYAQKIDMFKEIFDYIVIDTAPLLSVSDTSMLMAYADLNLVVSRHGVTKINEMKQILRICEQVGLNIDGIIYNAYERPSSYYGYYNLYGNYAYQYYAKKYLYDAYEYDKD